MKSSRFLLAAATLAALVSCASKQQSGYDTSNPYGSPEGGQAANPPYQPVAPVNPTYDTPAAYEDSSAAPAAAVPEVAAAPGHATAAAAPAAPAARNATTHTVAPGDTLGKIALQYKVPMASIKKANNMTKDTVVLGKKLVIPAR